MADIHVKSLSFAYDENPIFNDVHMHVKKKQFVGLIGPNGCGKSTLLKNIYKQFEPARNTIYIDDKDVTGFKPKDFARQMAVVSQESNHQFDFSVKEMVTMGRYAHKKLFDNDSEEDMKIVHDAIKRVGLKGFDDRSFLSLSGGEKQRVLIARALAQNSEVVILDEPTNHLDIKYQLQVMELLKSLNVTTFAAIHDFNIAAHYCDAVYVLHEGQVHSCGTPESVLNEGMFQEVFGVNALINTNPYTKKRHISFYV